MKSRTSIAYKTLTAFMIVMLALTAAPVSPAYAASAELSAWANIYTGAPGNDNGTINAGNLTVPAGANRIFVVAVCAELDVNNSMTTLSASLGGTPLTLIGSTIANGGAREHCYMGYLRESQIPAVASALTVPYNVSGGGDQVDGIHVRWATYSGVDQTNPIYDSGAAFTATNAITFGSTIDYLQNGLTFYVAGNGGSPATMTPPAGFTQRLVTTTNGHSSFTASITTAPHAAGGTYAANTGFTFTGTTSTRSALVVASLRPSLPPTTTTLDSSLNPSNPGDSVTFTATVAPAAATGTVSFFDGGVSMGPAVALAGGVAILPPTPLLGGSHSITAVYSGDATYGGSTGALTQGVNLAPTVNAVPTLNYTVGIAGAPYTITASGFPAPTFTLTGALPAGVNFDGNTGVLSGTPTLGTNAVGTYNLSVTATNTIGTSAAQNFTLNVIKRNQTIAVGGVPGAAGFGTSFTITPSATSGLTVSVVASGGCTLAGNVVTITAVANCVLTSNQVGDDDYNPAPQDVRTVTVNKSNTTVTVDPSPHTALNPSQSAYSHPMTFIVTVTSAGGIPTGNVTLTGGILWLQNISATLDASGVAYITINTNPANFLIVTTFLGAPTPHGLTIAYGGDLNFNGDLQAVSHTILPAPTQVTITSDVNPSAVGQLVTFTVTGATTAPGTGIPPGSVTLWDGTTQIGASTVLANGVATFTINSLAFGPHNISARFVNSNDNYASSNNTITPYVQNVRRVTTTTLTSNNNSSVYGENVTFTATVNGGAFGTPAGTVQFYDATIPTPTLLGTGTLNAGGVATFTTNALLVGAHPITAIYLPSIGSVFATSTSAQLNQIVTPKVLTITANNQNKPYGDVFTFAGTEFTTLGLINGNTVTSVTLTSTGALATAPASPPTYPVVPSAAVGTGLSNYTINYVDGALTVTRIPLTITADHQTKIYFTIFTFSGIEFSTTGLLAGDSVNSVLLTSTGAAQNATVLGSPYPIVITPGSAVGTGLSNYTITYVNNFMDVLASGTNVLTITANNQTKIYGDTFTFAGDEFTVTGLQGTDSVGSVTFTTSGTPPGANAAAVVGSYTITPSAASGSGLGNYVINYIPGQMDVTRRDLTYLPNNQTKTYGDVFPPASYSGAFGPLSDPQITAVATADNIAPIFNSAGAVATAAVGPHPILVTLDDPDGKLGNYNLPANLPTATLNVTPRALTVTANNQSKPYGTAFTFLGTEFTTLAGQLVNGDTVATVTLNSTGAPAAALASPPTYPIVPSLATGTGLGNYAITYVNGVMTVTKPTLTVTSFNQTKVYGDVFPNANFTGSITGIVNNDAITVAYASFGEPANAPVTALPYPITMTVSAPAGVLANYNVVHVEGGLAVTRRVVTIAANDLSKVYGDPATLTGIETGAFLDGITFAYSSPGTALTAPVGTYAIAITLTDPNNRLGNYDYTLTPATLTVTPRPITVTSDPQSKNYGTFFFAFTGGITNLANNDPITPNFASAGSLPPAAVGTYPITFTPLNDPTGKLGNYTVIPNIGLLTVGSSILTITAENKTITYGDAEPAFTFTYSGFAPGDTPLVLTTLPSCTVAGPHTAAGTYLNQIVCAGGADDAYSFNYIPATLTVNQRPLVVTPNNQTKVYGDVFLNANFTGTITGVQLADINAITVTYASPGEALNAPVGNHLITVTLNATPAVLANYTQTLNTGILAVTLRDLTVTPADKTKVYGDVFPDANFTGTITGIQNNEAITATYASPTGAIATATVAGSLYDITATLNAPAGVLTNYRVVVNIGHLDVTRRPLTVTPDDKAKAFGTVFNPIDYSGSVVGLIPADGITVAYASTGAPAPMPAGNYDITVTLTDPNNRLANYTQTLNTGTLVVGTNVLTITANNQTLVYGDPDPTFTFTYAGFQGTDDATVLTTRPTCQVLPAHNAAGTFPISCSGGVDDNYIFTYIPATLTVTPRAITVTTNNQTKVYGDAFNAYTGTVTGIQGADGITVSYASAGGAATAAVANYTIIPTLNDPNGRLANNYTQTITNGTLTVTRRPLVATPDNKNKVYGTLFTDYTGTLAGLVNNDAITPVYDSLGAPAAATSGIYDITVTLNATPAVLANYNVTLNMGVLTVGGNFLIVTPADKLKFYGNVFTAFTGTIVGLQPGDVITATYASTGAGAAAIVGDYDIIATLVDPGGKLGNYTVINNPGTLTVSPRDLVVLPSDKTKPYGVDFTAFSGIVVGIRNSDNITAAYDSAGRPAGAPVGDYDINATLVDPAGKLNNYDVTVDTGTLTVAINPNTITITIPAPATAGFGNSFTVAATASSSLPVVYSAGGTACSNAGATFTMTANTGVCIVQYDQPGDLNYPAATQLTQSVNTQKASQTITITTSAPVTSLSGTSFPVAATSSSSLPVSIISNGNCSGNGSNSATITIAGGTGICTIIYSQTGDANYLAATSITEIVSATNAPVITLNPVDAWVQPGATATFTTAATGNPSPTVQWQVSTDGGITFTDIPGATATTFSITAQLADSGQAYQAVFTNTQGSTTTTPGVLHVDNVAPRVTSINSVVDTGDARLDELEVAKVSITQLIVAFNEDLSNPVGNTAKDDVSNPANYVLVRDNGDGIQTAACSAGVIGGDIAVMVDLVSYNNRGGNGPYTASVYLNGGAALINGNYRLIVCGTTSITDLAGNKLAGDAVTTGTDFTRNFVVAVPSNEGGGNNNNNRNTQTSSGLLIPVTGFKQGAVTLLSQQPADKAYAATDLWLEIPKLGVKLSIVGVPQTKSGWDISWLGSNAGWLNGSAFPTWKGNSVITAHVWDALNKPGPFVGLINLQYGDQVKVHAFGFVYTYEVAGSSVIAPSNTSAAFKHEEKSWITLITCEDYKEKTGIYTSRRMVRALLVSVTKDK